jgi:energy-coupling factor transporter transmembrane protein EcfT
MSYFVRRFNNFRWKRLFVILSSIMTFLPPIIVVIVYFGFHTLSSEILLIIYICVLVAVALSISFVITILFLFSLFTQGRKAFDWSTNYSNIEPISINDRIIKLERKILNLSKTEDLATVTKRIENIEENIRVVKSALNNIIRKIKQGDTAKSKGNEKSKRASH